ncbi:MAG: hypothetical protein PHS92_04135 [Candidatus Gracilibacteria bacterium]|nr:hypothetical protein [Candidatus Gracilibacteria bacterium]
MTEIEKQNYIKKRESLLSSIEGLFGFWDLAPGIHALIKSQFVTPEILDSLSGILSEALKGIKDDEIRAKMTQSIKLIEKLREKETKEKKESVSAAERELLELQLI